MRESAARLLAFAKERGVATILVGHVTKEGALAGPKTLEHVVDAVIHFEGESGQKSHTITGSGTGWGAILFAALCVLSTITCSETRITSWRR